MFWRCFHVPGALSSIQQPLPYNTHVPSLYQLKHTSSPSWIHPLASEWFVQVFSASLRGHCHGLLCHLLASDFQVPPFCLGGPPLVFCRLVQSSTYLNPKLHTNPSTQCSLHPPLLFSSKSYLFSKTQPRALLPFQPSVILIFCKLQHSFDEPTHLQLVVAPMFTAELK